jgi:hypothetical protein
MLLCDATPHIAALSRFFFMSLSLLPEIAERHVVPSLSHKQKDMQAKDCLFSHHV